MSDLECPDCAANLTTSDNPVQGEIIDCGDCGAELEIIATNPLQVTVAPDVGEDWGE